MNKQMYLGKLRLKESLKEFLAGLLICVLIMSIVTPVFVFLLLRALDIYDAQQQAQTREAIKLAIQVNRSAEER